MEFPNTDKLLLPGMYVQVEMPTGVARNVLLVPQQGVTFDPRGNAMAMIVNAESAIEARTLDIIEAKGSDWIVRSGLASGDRVVVEGIQRIAPGAKVVAEERGATPTPGAADPGAAAPADASEGEAPARGGDAAPAGEAPPTGGADAPADAG